MKFQYFDTNQGFYRVGRFRDYNLTDLTTSGATFDFDTGSNTYDPTREAFKISFGFKNGVEAKVQTGPDAGGTSLLDGGYVFTSGVIESITYEDDLGNTIAKITGLNYKLPLFNFYLNVEPELFRLFDAIIAKGITVSGSSVYDDIATGVGSDKVFGRGGDDYIKDGGGKDSYDGGGGYDVLTYDQAFWSPEQAYRGIFVNMSAKGNKDFVIGYDGQKDSIKNIEGIRGTFRDDKFIGDNFDNWFVGFRGRDFFDGRGGFDVLRYDRDIRAGAYDGVIVDVAKKMVLDGSGDIDTFKNIEGFRGSDFADTFMNTGGKKNIFFDGRDGDDEFIFQNGSGFVRGGNGNDVFRFSGKKFDYDIDQFEFGTDSIEVDDFTVSQWTTGVSDSGDALLIFDDGTGNSAFLEFVGVTQASLDAEISNNGIGSIVSFSSPGSITATNLQDNGGSKTPGKFTPNIQMFDGNQNFHRYSRFNEANIDDIGYMSEIDQEGIRFLHDTATYGYDRTRNWDKAVLGIEKAEWHSYQTGSATTRGGWFDSGTYSGGYISSITFYNDLGFKILEATNLKVDLAWFAGYYAEEPDLWNLWRAVTAYSGVFVGSNFAGGPDTGWDGDELQTGGGNDLVKAMAGDDYILDNGGKDTYNGGAGFDVVSYQETFWNPVLLKKGILVNLGAKNNKDFVKGPDGQTDKLVSIEGVEGTMLRDVMLGDNKGNFFVGYGGNDLFNGRGGVDEVSYRNDDNLGGTSGIVANMQKGNVTDGFGNVDKLINIERVRGTDYDDSYIDRVNKNDYFRAGDGADTMIFRGGNDVARLDFDGDSDTIIFRGDAFGDNEIRGFDDGIDLIQIENATSFSDLTLTVINGDTLVEWNGNSILVEDVILDNTDFI